MTFWFNKSLCAPRFVFRTNSGVLGCEKWLPSAIFGGDRHEEGVQPRP